jgi:hypothetical protein
VALSDDQKALLRLLAQREEGYEDIAALLGLSVAEVRARVKGALAELDSTAAAAGKPEAAASAPSPAEPATRPEPVRARPAVPPAPPQRPAPRSPEPSSHRRPSLPKDRRRLFELAGGLLVVALIALFATGVLDIGGGDDDGSESAAPSLDAAATANGKLTQAVLTPPDGGDAIGRAIFGRVGKGPVLQVVAEGLEPAAKGESYTVWLYRTRKLVLRLGSVKVDKSGGLGTQLPLPVELFAYITRGGFNKIYVSRTDDAAYRAEVARAKKQKRLPAYTGTTVLRGEIVGPLVRG